MTGYLLDTNVVSELRKLRPHGGVTAWMKKQDERQIFVSAVTLGELQAGVELTRRQNSQKAAEIEAWIDQLAAAAQVLPLDTACAREWGRIMDGIPAHLLEDGMISATARVHGLVVATRNERDFRHFDVRLVNPFDFRG